MHKLETKAAFLVENTDSATETYCWTAFTKTVQFEPWSQASWNKPSVRAVTSGREPTPLVAVPSEYVCTCISGSQMSHLSFFQDA